MARSLSAQVLHYLSRPHEGAAREPVQGPAAWAGAELAERRREWTATLDPRDADAIAGEVERVTRSTLPLSEVGRATLRLPTLAAKIARWRDDLATGRGFVLVRGVPVERLRTEQAELFFWWLGLQIGTPGMQNEKGDLLGHVLDVKPATEARLYETSKAIRYHCDAADVVGLLCLRKAREGGFSRIASSVTIFNRLLAEEPGLAARLFAHHALDTHSERGIDLVRVPPCRFSRGTLRTFYHGDYFRTGASKLGRDVDAEHRLFDAYDAIGERPDVRLDMDLEPGDIQFVNNHTIVHARTAYVDHDEPSLRRHLLRLWLSLDDPYGGWERLSAAREGAALVSRLLVHLVRGRAGRLRSKG
jgi:hypothetical protein